MKKMNSIWIALFTLGLGASAYARPACSAVGGVVGYGHTPYSYYTTWCCYGDNGQFYGVTIWHDGSGGSWSTVNDGCGGLRTAQDGDLPIFDFDTEMRSAEDSLQKL